MRHLALLLLASTTLTAHAAPKPHAPLKAGITNRVFHPTELRNWRQAEHKELTVTIWYPAADTALETPQTIGPPDHPLFDAGLAAKNATFAPDLGKRPLIVLSHGTGGSAEQLAWLGTALARDGFIVAAVNHPGNNSHEPYTVEGMSLWWERATDLSDVIDGMVDDHEFGPHIDKFHIGAAGFSLGGLAVLEMAGAQTDINDYFDLCAPELRGNSPLDADTTVCHVEETRPFGTPVQMLRATRKTSAESLARSNASYLDERVTAVFAIAPALAFTFDEDSLHDINIPVEIVIGKSDRIAIARDNADYLHSMIHSSRETTLPGVNHYTFLDDCTAEGREKLPTYCTEAPGIERQTIHQQVEVEAEKFFERTLPEKH